MTTLAETAFLNVDLILESQVGVSRPLAALGESVIVLNNEGGGASLELAEQPSSPEEAVEQLLSLIDALPAEAREEWAQCTARTLDVGIQSGASPHDAAFRLSSTVLARAAGLGADVVFTVYACLAPSP
ncbi:hypothetical protein POL68_42100 [Stigmatella sp. ncwal1]|uniref:Uncharacterized protein n=1 Tax=Stigmatella ashevillensis TaxID=2995309 RepID=A0ABT5DNK4_9BACT|nr:hypothetical protein [Stigmatella ashevillena]MDC0715116.1 hypothetical protein [Stigmatella ashevillena]